VARTGRPASVDGGPAQPQLASTVIAALGDLGFSQYEARTYVGLVGREPMTGYGVAKQTQVPQPKVYETLGRLVERGAVLQISDSPARFIAVPPARLLAHMDTEFRQRMSTAELEMSKLRMRETGSTALRAYREASSWVSIAAAAVAMVDGCDGHVYISGHASHLDPLSESILQADERGVRVDILSFGTPSFRLSNGEIIRHSSTDRMVYPHHQARHLAVVSDSRAAMWALAPDGTDWDAIWADDDALFAAVVKDFIRHDIFLQRIFADFGEALLARYGAGLEGLYRSKPESSAATASENGEVARPA
jgi:HTH-type transcriptional regulator, sugar sensing transcriptional regulator